MSEENVFIGSSKGAFKYYVILLLGGGREPPKRPHKNTRGGGGVHQKITKDHVQKERGGGMQKNWPN